MAGRCRKAAAPTAPAAPEWLVRMLTVGRTRAAPTRSSPPAPAAGRGQRPGCPIPRCLSSSSTPPRRGKQMTHADSGSASRTPPCLGGWPAESRPSLQHPPETPSRALRISRHARHAKAEKQRYIRRKGRKEGRGSAVAAARRPQPRSSHLPGGSRQPQPHRAACRGQRQPGSRGRRGRPDGGCGGAHLGDGSSRIGGSLAAGSQISPVCLRVPGGVDRSSEAEERPFPATCRVERALARGGARRGRGSHVVVHVAAAAAVSAPVACARGRCNLPFVRSAAQVLQRRLVAAGDRSRNLRRQPITKEPARSRSRPRGCHLSVDNMDDQVPTEADSGSHRLVGDDVYSWLLLNADSIGATSKAQFDAADTFGAPSSTDIEGLGGGLRRQRRRALRGRC